MLTNRLCINIFSFCLGSSNLSYRLTILGPPSIICRITLPLTM